MMPDDPRRWRGFIDYVDEPFVVGWAFDARYPDLSLLVQCASSTGKRQVVPANVFRQDLKDHNLGDGRHGFVANLETFSAEDGPIAVTILGGAFTIAENIAFGSLDLRGAIPAIPGFFAGLMAVTALEVRVAADRVVEATTY